MSMDGHRIHNASQGDRDFLLIPLLAQFGAIANCIDNEGLFTPFLRSCYYADHFPTFQALLAMTKDIAETNSLTGENALHLLCKNHLAVLMKMILMMKKIVNNLGMYPTKMKLINLL